MSYGSRRYGDECAAMCGSRVVVNPVSCNVNMQSNSQQLQQMASQQLQQMGSQQLQQMGSQQLQQMGSQQLQQMGSQQLQQMGNMHLQHMGSSQLRALGSSQLQSSNSGVPQVKAPACKDWLLSNPQSSENDIVTWGSSHNGRKICLRVSFTGFLHCYRLQVGQVDGNICCFSPPRTSCIEY